MGIMDKMKALTEKTVDVTKGTVLAAKEAYKEGGIESVGFKAGQASKELVSDITDYAGQVTKEAKKAGRPAGIAFSKEQPTAQAAAKIALGVIAGMRKVTSDTVEKFNSLEPQEKIEETKSISRNKP